MKAPFPENETERLHLLKLYRILDTVSERAFDDLTRLAASICQVPISLVSLVDADRQWFKSRHGLDATETHRDAAFCGHAILHEDVLIVEDAQEDPRFADNPLVTGAPHIRFYAGAPLQVESGHRFGTLCVIDTEPRTMDAQQLESLEILRDAVLTQMELRRARQDMQTLEQFLAMCAWCRSVRVDDAEGQRWVGADDYVSSAVPVTHGICPPCRDALH
ncbi:MAG: GAF domain-containing protein [Planctomycetota bacterium]